MQEKKVQDPQFTIVNTEKICRGRWVGIVKTEIPFKATTNVSAESEYMAFHKLMRFFDDDRRPLSKVHNELGGYTYTLPEQKQKS